MVVRSKGLRSKTRSKMRKRVRERGSVPITRAMQSFEKGEVVHVVIDSAWHKGAPHPKWHGKTGVIAGQRGRAYLVKLRDQEKEKIVIAAPVHLRKA